jgi:hypothetical protein
LKKKVFRTRYSNPPALQLLYEIHFIAASEALPLTCRRLHDIFKNAPPGVHVDYLLGRHAALPSLRRCSINIITYALRFPICSTPSVLAALFSRPHLPRIQPHPQQRSAVSSSSSSSSTANASKYTNADVARTCTAAGSGRRARPRPKRGRLDGPPELPKRIFDRLSPSGAEALPLLRFLYTYTPTPSDADALVVRPNIESHNGYPLVRAVFAGAVPVVCFLLEHGASPCRQGALSVKVAIRRRDLALVRLLVEPPEAPSDGRKKLADRVQVTSEMLKIAVMSRALDITEYLVNEKGCVPDLETLSYLSAEV